MGLTPLLAASMECWRERQRDRERERERFTVRNYETMMIKMHNLSASYHHIIAFFSLFNEYSNYCHGS